MDAATEYLISRFNGVVKDHSPGQIAGHLVSSLLHREAALFVPQKRRAREKNRSLLYRTELVEIPAKEDNRDPAEIPSRLSESAELLVHGMQRPRTEHTHLVHDQQVVLLPVHLRLPVDSETSRAGQREPVHICVSNAPWYRIFGEPTGGVDSDFQFPSSIFFTYLSSQNIQQYATQP